MEAWENTRSTKRKVVSFNIYKTGFIISFSEKLF